LFIYPINAGVIDFSSDDYGANPIIPLN